MDQEEGDLRFCMNNAGNGDTITFQVGGSVQLNSPLLPITQGNLTINGGAWYPTINENGAEQTGSIFTINPGASASIQNLYIIGGLADNGGAINNFGALSLVDDWITNNVATQEGGGIYNNTSGSITLQDVSIGENSAQYGGGISSGGSITSSTMGDGSSIYKNTAAWDGGGILNWGNMNLNGENIFGNTARSGSGGGVANYGSGASFTLYGNGSFYSLYNNVAGLYGGGLYNQANAYLEGVQVEINSAYQGGGIFLGSTSTTTLDSVTVNSNYTKTVAPGIAYLSGANMNFTSVTDSDDPGGNPVEV